MLCCISINNELMNKVAVLQGEGVIRQFVGKCSTRSRGMKLVIKLLIFGSKLDATARADDDTLLHKNSVSQPNTQCRR